jgi:hypothetical protein
MERAMEKYSTRDVRIWLAGVALVCLFGSTLASAAPPFEICRSTDASQVAAVVPLDVVWVAPYDDAPDLLDDGVSYVYMIRDGAGQRVTLSIHKNTSLRTVRLGFDDENPLSAPVDASLSAVVLSRDTIPADGVTFATVVITPRDSNGIPLGAGLDVTIDGFALWPGSLRGPVTDMGDGTYVVQVISSTPGSGDLWVSVEGIALNDEPTLTFEDAGDPLSLRDQARVQLDGMTSDGGLFEQALGGLDPATDPGAEKLEQARVDALEALGGLPDGNLSEDASAIDNELKSAIGELASALDDPGQVDPAALQALIDYLLDAARMVALEHLIIAESTCGPCDGSGGEVCDAEEALDEADAERASPDPDYEEAANLYGVVIDKTLDAIADCG